MKVVSIITLVLLALGSLTAAPGDLVWKTKTDGALCSSPCISQDKVYVGSMDRYLYAFNAQNGNAVWIYKTGGKILSSPCVANAIVYFGSYDQYVYAVNAINGSFVWRYKTKWELLYPLPVLQMGRCLLVVIICMHSMQQQVVLYGKTWQEVLVALHHVYIMTGSPLEVMMATYILSICQTAVLHGGTSWEGCCGLPHAMLTGGYILVVVMMDMSFASMHYQGEVYGVTR